MSNQNRQIPEEYLNSFIRDYEEQVATANKRAANFRATNELMTTRINAVVKRIEENNLQDIFKDILTFQTPVETKSPESVN